MVAPGDGHVDLPLAELVDRTARQLDQRRPRCSVLRILSADEIESILSATRPASSPWRKPCKTRQCLRPGSPWADATLGTRGYTSESPTA
jgi:hypothetical protein